MTAHIFLIFATARQQSLLINGAIGLQVVVGAITTGVAAASKNVISFRPMVSESCCIDALTGRSGLPSPFLVASLPR